MKQFKLECCEKRWWFTLDSIPLIGYNITLRGLDENNEQAEFVATITRGSFNPYKACSLTLFASPHMTCEMTYEYIKENITPKDAIHD